MRKGFTLIELLVTVAIIAVIGAGVAVYYGRDLVDNARREMTLHEMGQIRDAFQRFYSDNAAQIMDGVTVADTDDALPQDFGTRFGATLGVTYAAPTATSPQRLYGMIEFFERYGLWPLVQDSIRSKDSSKLEVQAFKSAIDARKYTFGKPSLATGEGWRGPYINSANLVDCVVNDNDDYVLEATVKNGQDGAGKDLYVGIASERSIADSAIRFPQPATKYNDGGNGGFYRIVYCEHCAEEVAGKPIYRRLLLMAAEKPVDYDIWDEIKVFTGNRREGDAEHLPIDLATGGVKTHDPQRGVFFMELMNLDTVWK